MGTKQCEKQGLAADGATKRRILGEEVVKGIRFPTMKQEDFVFVVFVRFLCSSRWRN